MSTPARITIVGAGLAGTLAAILLARRGFRVGLYERRADMRRTAMSAGRSINLALSVRGITALERAGLADAVLERAIAMHGRRMHDLDGSLTFQPYGLEGQHINSVSRGGLNMTLLDAAEALDGVELFFEHRCVELLGLEDPNRDTVTAVFERPDGTHQAVASEVLIGADGAFSAVRLAMMMTVGFDYAQSYLGHGYKELSIPPGDDGDFRLEPNALHIWPRHRNMLIALPNHDRSFTCTLFLPRESEVAGESSFATLRTPAEVERFFAASFPDAVAHLPTLTQDFFDNPTGALVTMRCLPYHRGRSLLIGDAAHAVVPFYGQGMNAAFEDCRILDELVEAHGGGDWPAVLERFTAERKRHADAIADLALANFHEMQSHVADEAFLRRKALEKELHRLIPRTYLPLYSMVSFSNIPYDDARRRAARQDEILSEVLPAVMGGELSLETVAARMLDELGPFEGGTVAVGRRAG